MVGTNKLKFLEQKRNLKVLCETLVPCNGWPVQQQDKNSRVNINKRSVYRPDSS